MYLSELHSLIDGSPRLAEYCRKKERSLSGSSRRIQEEDAPQEDEIFYTKAAGMLCLSWVVLVEGQTRLQSKIESGKYFTTCACIYWSLHSFIDGSPHLAEYHKKKERSFSGSPRRIQKEDTLQEEEESASDRVQHKPELAIAQSHWFKSAKKAKIVGLLRKTDKREPTATAADQIQAKVSCLGVIILYTHCMIASGKRSYTCMSVYALCSVT